MGVFFKTVGIPMSTNFDAPFLVDLFLYSNEVDLIQGLLEKNKKKLAQFFNFTCVFLNDAFH